MRNKHGSVLVITLGFVVAFTLLGMASLHYAMVQNEETERQKASMEAFWLADGAIELAKAKYPDFIAKDQPATYLLNSAGETDLNRYYDVHSRKKKDESGNDRLNRYEVFSYGKVNGQLRYIKAELDKFNLPDYPFITTSEPIKSPVEPRIVEKVEDFFDEVCDAQSKIFEENVPELFTGVTCVNIEKSTNEVVLIPSADKEANVLVIDVTTANRLNNNTFVPTITFKNPINGLVLIKGNVKFKHENINAVNLIINGTLLVDGKAEFVDIDSTDDNQAIVFNAEYIDKALTLIQSDIPIGFSNTRIISWEEVSQLDEQI